MLQFDPNTGISIPDTATLREQIATDVSNAFTINGQAPLTTEPSTPGGQITDIITAQVESVYAQLAAIVNQISPSTAEGRMQDALCKLYFITRKYAEPTLVTCQLTGIAGTVVPYGVQVKSTGGYTLVNTEQAVIGANGTTESIFRVSEWGAISIPAHTVTQIVTTIAGWDTVDNAAAGVLGRDVETQAELENRRMQSVAKNSMGTVAAISGALWSLPGVLDCQVLENYTNEDKQELGLTLPPHSVTCCVYGGSDDDIAEVLYSKRGAGCATGGTHQVQYTEKNNGKRTYTFNIVRPSAKTVSVTVKLAVATLGADVQQEIKYAIARDFVGNGASGQPRVGLGQTLYALRFVNAVNSVSTSIGLLEIQVQLDGGPLSSSISIDADVEPVLTSADVNIVLNAGGS